MNKICPIISQSFTKQNAYGGAVPEIDWQECQQENCQWWWKCKDPEPKSVRTTIDMTGKTEEEK